MTIKMSFYGTGKVKRDISLTKMTLKNNNKSFWFFLGLVLVVIIPVVSLIGLAIPGIAFYKMKHGIDAKVCYAVFAGYAFIWIAFVTLHFRFRSRDKLWSVLFGICFYALLAFALKL